VVQDKPLATRAQDADELVRAVEAAGVQFLMWNRNFFPAVIQARDQVASGIIGTPTAIHADFFFAKDAGPRVGTRQPGYPPIDWLAHQLAAHVDGADGGLGVEAMGELAVEGIYPLGYIHAIARARVRRVFARSASFFHQAHADHGVEDLASVSLEMDGGIQGSFAVGRIGLASHPSGGEIKLHILGTRGALIVNEAKPDVGIYYRDQPPKEPRQRRVALENDFLLADHFVQALDTGTDTIMNARLSRSIYATVAAALESCRTGQCVTVNEGEGEPS
jgi:predicted dehydrogenase